MFLSLFAGDYWSLEPVKRFAESLIVINCFWFAESLIKLFYFYILLLKPQSKQNTIDIIYSFPQPMFVISNIRH